MLFLASKELKEAHNRLQRFNTKKKNKFKLNKSDRFQFDDSCEQTKLILNNKEDGSVFRDLNHCLKYGLFCTSCKKKINK